MNIDELHEYAKGLVTREVVVSDLRTKTVGRLVSVGDIYLAHGKYKFCVWVGTEKMKHMHFISPELIAEKRQDLRPTGGENIGKQITATHPYGFMFGEWGTVIGTTEIFVGDDLRSCYVVEFPYEGVIDLWPVSDPSDSYDFREAE